MATAAVEQPVALSEPVQEHVEQEQIQEPTAPSREQEPAETKKKSSESEDKEQCFKHLVDNDPSEAFSCNICLELAKDPVVTLCGHLYCWPCIYRWMQLQSFCRQCPVCKAGVEVDKVVPIYGRGSENPEPSQDLAKLQPLPPRPVGQRIPPVQLPTAHNGAQQHQQQQQQQQQQGVLQALFGFQLGPGQGYVEALTPEQQHQAFLSRLLLMLGSFVIMCLLLF